MRRIVPMYSGICADVASISVEHNTKKSDVSPDVSRRSTVHRAAAGRTFLWDKVQQRTPGNHHRINPVRWMTWAPEPTGVWHLPDVAGLPRMMTRHDRTWGPPWDCGLLNGCLAVCFMEEMSGQCSWWQKHIYIYIFQDYHMTHMTFCCQSCGNPVEAFFYYLVLLQAHRHLETRWAGLNWNWEHASGRNWLDLCLYFSGFLVKQGQL